MPRFAQPDYYITSFPICQGVFQKFFKNFFQPLLAGAEVPEHYTTSSRVCQEVFQKFFQLFSRFFARRRSRSSLLSSDSQIIALSFPFVNRFLQSFLSLEKVAGVYKKRALRLYTMPNK